MKKHNFGNLHTLSDTKMACDTQSVHAKISSSKRRFGKGMSGKPLFGTCGATLVWAVVVGVVLLIITGTIAMVVSRSYTNTATSSHNTQAYYTARSINESIVNWLQNTPAQSYSGTVSGSSSGTYANAGSGSSSGTYANADGGSSSKVGNNANELNDQQLFINDLIAAGSIHEHYDSADLGGTMGAADINITINDEHDEITVTTVSDYNGETHRIVSRLNAQEDSLFTYETGGDFSLQPTFDEHSYDSIIANINTGSNGFASDLSPVNIQLRAPNGQNASSYGENNVATTKRDYNVENRATLANLIASDNLTREATMRETTTLYGTNYSTGPADFPWIGGSLRNNTTTTGPNAKMMMLAPANGKIMINPVCYTNGGDSYSHALNSSPNIKNANFVITDTADKSIKLRLANSGDGERRGTGGSRVLPKFAWVGLDFYDNNTPFLTIPVPGVSDVAASIANPADVSSGVTLTPLNDAIPFYPNSWLDCTIYLKNSAAESIDSTLLFGNYNRIHTYATLDYYSWANYITYHWGYQNNNYNLMQRIGFKTSSTTNYAKDKSGYQYPPTYWGDNFSMYLLDGAYTNEQAWLMQGVTIGNTAKADGSASGVVYATRGLKIGGSLTIKAGNQTFEGVYTTLDGFDGNLGSGIYSTSQVYQPTYHQAITNTNLIFGAAANKTVSHEILHPDSIHGYEGRTLSILGGNIYVGGSSAENARSILTIDSEVKDGIKVDGQVEADGVTVTPINSGYRNIIAYTENGNRMYIQPNEMIVGDGGTIIVRGNANDHDNVNPGIIYVQSGGTLTLENGAKVLTSKIVVDAGGTLNIQGSARVMATIVIKHGGKLVISGGATIIGDVLVRGDMSLGGTLTVNLPQPMPLDNPDTVWSEADPRYHGVFIFNGTILGSGTLSVSGAPFVQGTSGKIHNMVNSQGFPPPLITDAQAANIFCTDPDPEPVTNICRHFSTGNSIWILASTEGG